MGNKLPSKTNVGVLSYDLITLDVLIKFVVSTSFCAYLNQNASVAMNQTQSEYRGVKGQHVQSIYKVGSLVPFVIT